ncbi:MAG: alpha/beta hydrolase, partial [Pseudomonadota bacterium]
QLCNKYRVIAPDLRGHGQSDWVSDGDYTIMDFVYDLRSLIEHLGIGTFTLVGHSLGGNIALRYAGMFPDTIEKLVALEGLGPSPRMLAERQSMPITQRLHEWLEQRQKMSVRTPRIMADIAIAQARMQAAFEHLPEQLIHHLTVTGLKQNDDGTVSWAYDPAGMGRSPADLTHEAVVELWGQITCPTWLVYGADSWASNPAEDGRAKAFRNADVSLIANAGHWLHHDQFDVFMTQLQDFLGRGASAP